MTPFDIARARASAARIGAAEFRKHGNRVSDAIALGLERGALSGLIRVGLPALEVLSAIGATIGTWSTESVSFGLRIEGREQAFTSDGCTECDPERFR